MALIACARDRLPMPKQSSLPGVQTLGPARPHNRSLSKTFAALHSARYRVDTYHCSAPIVLSQTSFLPSFFFFFLRKPSSCLSLVSVLPPYYLRTSCGNLFCLFRLVFGSCLPLFLFLSGRQEGVSSERGKWEAPETFVRTTTKYWLRPDRVVGRKRGRDREATEPVLCTSVCLLQWSALHLRSTSPSQIDGDR